MPKKFKVPANEVERLNALLKLRLKTGEDDTYTIITSLAASIMGTEVAMLTFVGADTSWTKASIGMPNSESPREDSFCTHVILTPDEPTIITDATKDERFANNPYVVGDPKIRFYFGAPLVTSGNEAVGSLCVIDSEVKEPNEFQINAMQALSKLVMAQLELREFIFGVHDELQELKKQDGSKIETSEVYKTLDMKCDAVLAKIKARRDAANSQAGEE